MTHLCRTASLLSSEVRPKCSTANTFSSLYRLDSVTCYSANYIVSYKNQLTMFTLHMYGAVFKRWPS